MIQSKQMHLHTLQISEDRAGSVRLYPLMMKGFFMINKLFFQPDNAWAGDPIPFFNDHDGNFYLFYLHDKRLTSETAYNTSWNLAVSKDLVTWEDMGTVLFPGHDADIDLSCYTGSIIRGKDNLYHMFYTAQNPDNTQYCISGKPIQYIIHAVSSDLLKWEKHLETAFTSPTEEYTPFDWRDPHVFIDHTTGEYCMLIATRYKNGAFRKGGVTLICRSSDLVTWSEPHVFYAPSMFYTHECPDIFYMNGWWYLLFSTFTQKFATHYRMSRSLNGPWLIPNQDTLDGRGLYAIKTAASGHRRFCFGWIPTKEGGSDFNAFQWGGTLAIHELSQAPDGSLHVKMPDEFLESCNSPLLVPSPAISTGCTARLKAEETQYLFYNDMHQYGILTLDLLPSHDTLDFGLFLHVDASLEKGYYFRFEPHYRRVVFDFWPRSLSMHEQHKLNGDVPFQSGFERWISDSDFSKLHLELICHDTIMILYINKKTALSVRIANPSCNWGLFTTRGTLEAEHIQWHSF